MRERLAMTMSRQITAPIAMRAATAKRKPAPMLLHLMASGVVAQIMITPMNATTGGIVMDRLEKLEA
jgi:hypothetical protein